VLVFLNRLRFDPFGVFLCSHVFGTGSDTSDSDGRQTAAVDDIEDEYETVRRQLSAKRARASQRSASVEV
jgi:hypothetical protein